MSKFSWRLKTLSKDKVLVVGLGEVGIPLFELLKESKLFDVYGLDIDEAKMRELGQTEPPSKVDVMHVCVRCTNREKLVKTATDYAKRFSPKLIIIESTVPPGTTTDVYKNCKQCLVAHSPVRGVHKSREHMKWEFKRWTKYVGGTSPEAARAAQEHFQKLGMKTKILKSSLETELAKLFETSYRSWMIACFQEMHRIAKHFEADFDDAVDFLEDTHRVRLDRPEMFPGEIGGHCLIPNTKLLLESYDSEFLRLLLESNEKRKHEMKDPKTKEEAEKIKKRAEKLQQDIMEKWIKK
jgi:UDP-N-acetyl-D-mannosaminuronate dehydrogenase